MKKDLSLVSVIIPSRDEEKYIGKCLDSMITNDYPQNKLEVLVMVGTSKDRTREIVERYAHQYSFIKLLDNPKKFTPFALNIGIKQGKGEIIIRMDAHATYGKDYISKCVKYLNEYDSDSVGGILGTVPGNNTITAKCIALSLSHPFGAGNSYFRISSKEPRWVDTVFGGCYKREVFKRIGLFNENLIRSQDMEFNIRLRQAGGKILLVPGIVAYYYAQPDLWGFLSHNFVDGIWMTYPLKFGTRIFSWRHLVPLVFVLGLVGAGVLGIFFPIFSRLLLFVAGSYFLSNIYFSAKIAMKEKDWRYFLILPTVFAARHIPYGLGSIWGLIKSLKKNY